MVRVGLEVILDNFSQSLAGMRLGLVTHPAAVTARLVDAVTALRLAGANLRALFGPEHGLAGMAADGSRVEHSVDARTGLPVFSLFGPQKEPDTAMLAGIDALIFDMQDVGVRFYTYLSTLYHVLRGAARAGVRVVVLDRPNPLGGQVVEGPLLEPGFESFVGMVPIAVRHGLTLAELAGWMNARLDPPAELQVVKMEGWRREMGFDGTGLQWVPSSPAMPHLSTAVVYPGTCLLEGTNCSEGRGTALPFEQIGAPWMDGWRLAEQMNELGLPGVTFRPAAFIPSASKHAGTACSGVQLHVTNRHRFRPLRTGLHLLAVLRDLNPHQFEFMPSSWEGRPPHFDLLMGSAHTRQLLLDGAPAAEIAAEWTEVEQAFQASCRPFWLYPDSDEPRVTQTDPSVPIEEIRYE